MNHFRAKPILRVPRAASVPLASAPEAHAHTSSEEV
jgi:hypothetical protein